MESYPSNSHASKAEDAAPEPKRVEKIDGIGAVRQRKTPLGRRLTETFVGGDAKSALAFVIGEVLVPAAKDMAADAVTQGFERLIFGEVKSRSRSGSRLGGGGGFVNYSKMSTGGMRREEPRNAVSPRARRNFEFEEIILATRPEAETVVERMKDILDSYETVTVSDLYGLVGITPAYTDSKWGWGPGHSKEFGVTRTRGGDYLLDLPRPEPVDE